MTFLLFALFASAIAVTVWGWVCLPVSSRFPVSLGVPPSVEGTVGKRVGLTLWLLIAAFLFRGSLFLAPVSPGMAWIGASLSTFFLLMEVHMIRRLKHP
jgi:hypothetical protein